MRSRDLGAYYENAKTEELSTSMNTSVIFTKGVMWSGTSSFLNSLFRFGILIFLVRILGPYSFGLFSLTLIIVDFGNDIGDFGMGPALVQKQNINKRLLDSIFWTVLIGCSTLTFIAVLTAPIVAHFFHESILIQLIIVSSISFIIRGAGLVHKAMLLKHMLFKKIAIIECGSTIIFGASSILFIYFEFGVWSLIYGLLLQRLLDTILSWCFWKYRPSFQYNYKEIREVLKFAKNITGERISYFISSRMDYIIVGRVLSTTALGFYTLASELTTLPAKRISTIVSGVAFPTFSIMQNNNDGLRRAYLKVNKTLSLITFPLLAGLFVLSSQFVHIFYDSSWIPTIMPMQILCLVGAIKSIMHNNGAIFYAKNRTDISLKWGVIQLVIIPLPLILGSFYGLPGIAVALSVTYICFFVYLQRILNSLLEIKIGDYLNMLMPSVAYSLGIILLCTISKGLLNRLIGNNIVLEVSILILASTICYLLIIYRYERNLWAEITGLLKASLKPRAT